MSVVVTTGEEGQRMGRLKSWFHVAATSKSDVKGQQ